MIPVTSTQPHRDGEGEEKHTTRYGCIMLDRCFKFCFLELATYGMLSGCNDWIVIFE